jgi:hypothetical protein
MLLFFAINILLISIKSSISEKSEKTTTTKILSLNYPYFKELNITNINITNLNIPSVVASNGLLEKLKLSNNNSNKNTLNDNNNKNINYNNNTKTLEIDIQKEIDIEKEKNLRENKGKEKEKVKGKKSSIESYIYIKKSEIIEKEKEENLRYKFINENKLRLLQEFKCIDRASCSNHGNCTINKDNCDCDIGYLSVILDNQDPKGPLLKCNYEQKSQLRAFLYELFLGFGAGHFYTGRYKFGGAKLSAFIFGIFIICLFPIIAKWLSEKLESDCLVLTVSCFYYLCSIGLAFWFIYDLVEFGGNHYLDGNNQPLLSWSKNNQ